MTPVRSCRPHSKYSEPPSMNWLRLARSAAASGGAGPRLRAPGRDANRQPAGEHFPKGKRQTVAFVGTGA